LYHCLTAGFKDSEKREKVRHLVGMDYVCAVGLGVSYFCFTFCRQFLAPLSAAMVDDPDLGYTNTKHGELLVAVGMTYGIAQVLNGLVVDALNPKHCYAVFFVVSSICVFSMSLVTDIMPDASHATMFNYMTLCLMINASVQSGGHPAACKFIFIRFKPAQYGAVFRILGFMASFGLAMTSIILGACLKLPGSSWQKALWIAVSITLMGLVVIFTTFRMPKVPHLDEQAEHDLVFAEDQEVQPTCANAVGEACEHHFDDTAPAAVGHDGHSHQVVDDGACAAIKMYGSWGGRTHGCLYSCA
jgi:sugar phosphate permease